MTEQAIKTGLSKSNRCRIIYDSDKCYSALAALTDRLRTIWDQGEENILSVEEAIELLDKTKSPGYPWYYTHDTKGSLIESEDFEEVVELVCRILEGEDTCPVFSFTGKSELRDRVRVLLHKTRVFMSSPIEHLIASKILYERQNERLIETLEDHPITIGIQIPGPSLPRALLRLKGDMYDGDVDGCDLGFNPTVAKFIMLLRHNFLPSRYLKAGQRLYSSVYCGYGVILGNIYRLDGNKSGWNNTGHDNSLYVWFNLIVAALYLYPDEQWFDVFDALINGDDLVMSLKKRQYTFFQIAEFCRLNGGFQIETLDWAKKDIFTVSYLSQTVRYRYHSAFGDFLIVAGNLPKLKSSLNWVKTNKNLTFEESCVAHLLGLRLCLYPWQIEFEDCDLLLTNYLKTIGRTPVIGSMLSGRLTELEITQLHLRYEGGVNDGVIFSHSQIPKEVLKVVRRLFKICKSQI